MNQAPDINQTSLTKNYFQNKESSHSNITKSVLVIKILKNFLEFTKHT